MKSGATFAGRHLTFVVNVDWFFESHRLPVALALLDRGADVSLITAVTDRAPDLAAYGIQIEPVPVSRRGKDPREMASLVRHLRSVLSRLRPSLVHNVTVKPVLAGSIAAVSLDRGLPVVNAISGFGHLLSDPEAGRLVPQATRLAYRAALRAPRRTRVVVQNDEAAQALLSGHLARSGDVRLIPGMGVDIERFKPAIRGGESSPIVMMASRLIRSKGVLEFVEAASRLRLRFHDVRFVLVGAPDPGNPLSLDEAVIREFVESGDVEWWGETHDMATTMRQADVFVLPTYHEGLPKVLLEAAASGLPIITSDIAGCRQILRNSRDALLLPPRDTTALVGAIARLLDDRPRARELGTAARARAVEEFTVQRAVDAHLAIYADLLKT